MRINIVILLLVFSCFSQAAEQFHFRDLYGRGGTFSELAQQKTGQEIRVRGYMAPPIKAQASFFVLTKMPMSFCPFCESEADWPNDIMLIKADENIEAVPYNMPIYVTGKLEIGTQLDPNSGFLSRVRLVNATFKKSY